MKVNIFWADVADVSAVTKTLLTISDEYTVCDITVNYSTHTIKNWPG